jgi:signal transduction histidine kinase/CheY-like chemotaxis protein
VIDNSADATEVLRRWVLRYGPARMAEGNLPWAMVGVLILMALMLVFAAVGDYKSGGIGPLLLGALYGVVLLAVARGLSVSHAVQICMLGGSLQLISAIVSHGGIFSPRMGWLLVLPLAPYFFLGRKEGDRWFALMVVVQVLFLMASSIGLLNVDLRPAQGQAGASYLSIQVMLVIMILLPFIYDRAHRKAIADIRQTQQELEHTQHELELSQSQRDRFISSVSHELRTPMNAIFGFNQLLLERVKDNPEAKRILEHTQYSADHLMTVINDVLDYSQLQTGSLQLQPQVFDLGQCVRKAFAVLEPKAKAQRLLYLLDVDEQLPRWVFSDEHRVVQILVNLLGNALKFTSHGSVKLRVRPVPGGLEFAVHDTGIGIPLEKQDKIFKRFSQADGSIQKRFGGNGLGLAISLKLAQLLGGDIGFSSEEGQGWVFWLKLPLAACDPPSRAHLSDSYQLRTAHKAWCFLVADDHPINRLLVQKVLLNAWPNSTIIEAIDGQDAVEKISQYPVDVAFMDMRMPRLDGSDATVRVRQQLGKTPEQLPIMGLTANVSQEDLARFQAAGLNGLMLKPFDWKKLCEDVDQWLVER